MSKPDHPTRRSARPLPTTPAPTPAPTIAPGEPPAPDPLASLVPPLAPPIIAPPIIGPDANALTAPDPAPPPVIADSPADTPYLDANGFDPAAYRWVPVLRKPRPDGWTPEKQRAFIETLADTGSVTRAAQLVGVSTTSAYRLRRTPGAEGFAAAWDAALAEAVGKLVDTAFDRALHGTYENILNRDGQRVGARIRYNDRMLMFLMRAHMPATYARAYQGGGYPGTHPRARSEGDGAPPPLTTALAAMEPAEPAQPHQLLPPAELDVEIECADLADGKLPPWYRDRDMLAAEAERRGDPLPGLGPEFEAALAAAKAAGRDRPGDDGDWDGGCDDPG